ncbi:MAG: EVE domain-containing protein [Pseudomonadales bacterium]|nr:EVE domain-containing protein [Pseudomonadales bacterium]
MNYWLFKSEPDAYSIDDLAREKSGAGRWDGIRNYQARNILRDQIKVGDKVFFYHSSCKIPGIAGIAKVVKAAYPDPSQFNEKSSYFDNKSTVDNPRWYCVDISLVEKFTETIPLKRLKTIENLAEMTLLKQGRLSIQPVTPAAWKTIVKLAASPQQP